MRFEEPVIRHLHYFVWPVKGNGTWRHNLDQLLRRIDLFNGRRRIGIATSDNADPPEVVQDYLRGYDCEFHVAPNDKKLREVVQFLPLLSPLESKNPNEVIFFAHAKGVSHGPPDDPKKIEHRWATIMYDALLDHWPLVEESLTNHAFVGTFRVFGQFRRHFDWHYAGTFYWARSAFLFDLPWRGMDQQLWGTETWPGRICHPSHAACLFYDNFNRRLLNVGDWNRNVEPEFERWKEKCTIRA